MYEEYGALYTKYRALYGPKTSVLLMVGSFYELYDRRDPETGTTLYNIQEVTDLLGIQLTVKKADKEPGEPLFAGFPDYALHKHAARLTAVGWTVVVVDQAASQGGKGKLKREVSRILSPATHLEASSSFITPLLTTLYQSKDAAGWGLASLDLTTGSTSTYQGSREDVIQYMTLYSPSEVLLYADKDPFPFPKGLLVHRRGPASPGAFAVLEVAADYLKSHYAYTGLLPIRTYLSLSSTRADEFALLFLLQFAEEHMPSALRKLQRNEPWTPHQTLICGNKALDQLQMPEVAALVQGALTPMGKRDIRTRLLRPLLEPTVIEKRLGEVKACLGLPQEAMRRTLRYVGDLPRMHRRVLLATATVADFVNLGQSYSALADLQKAWPSVEGWQLPPDLEATLVSYRALYATHISLPKALQASDDVTPFHSDTYPDLKRIENEIQTVLDALEALRARFATLAASDSLKLESREKEPFGLKASASALKTLKGKTLPAGTVLQILKSGGWIETPELTTLNGRLVAKRQQLSQAAHSVQLQVCHALSAWPDAWTLMETWSSSVDCTQAIAAAALTYGWSCPTIVADRESFLDIENLRHPLVEATGTRTPYVQHTVKLDSNSETNSSGWLVYGMNASGKSTLMKAVGIAVLLAQAGCYVPAKRMSLAPFRAVYTRILNYDNLAEGLSSFATEMTELRQILRGADPSTLVLGDELCAGTESVSAMSLVGAGIQWLSEKRAKYIFATHLHDLPTLLDPPSLRLAIWHLHVEYDPATQTLVYHRQLRPGSGSSLYGLEVARAMDLPPDFLELALANRRSLLGSVRPQDAKPSAWNPAICRRLCEVCGKEDTRTLEVHHLQERATASANGLLEDGTPVHAPSNLKVLCASCHDKQHVPTKQGRPDDELATIHALLKKYKTATLKALVYQLKSEHDIDISSKALSAERAKMI
jgi:DNA mismatch repair protein MutS